MLRSNPKPITAEGGVRLPAVGRDSQFSSPVAGQAGAGRNVSNLVWIYPASLLITTLGWLALLSPWMAGRGTYTFYYHYLPAYACALLGLARLVRYVERKRPAWVFAFIAAATLVALVPRACLVLTATARSSARDVAGV